MKVNTLDMPPKSHMMCKGPSNEDKGHHELMEDTKREPYKKRLHP